MMSMSDTPPYRDFPRDRAASSGRWAFPVLAAGLALSVVAGPVAAATVTEPAPAAAAPTGLVITVGILVFLVGISFAGFLWWLNARFFTLLETNKLSTDGLAALKDLPMGMPEGTVRAILALIVAVVGLPIFIFANVLHLDNAILGYANGIITGVFGFYFGTRTAGAPAQALNQISRAETRAVQAEKERDEAISAAQATQTTADAATRGSRFDEVVDKLDRHVKLASTLVNVLGPALPDGLLPAGVKDAVANAESVLNTVKGLTREGATEDQVSQITDVLGGLLGGGSGGASMLGTLLGKAAPMLGGLAIPGLGPVAGLATLLSVGARLGSQEYQRWRARVLAAPLSTGLIDFGTVTPDEVGIALDAVPDLRSALAPAMGDPRFEADLADMVLHDDGEERMWAKYGPGGSPAIFTDRQSLSAGLAALRRALLAKRSATDVPESLVQQVGTAVAGTSAAALDHTAVERMIAAVSDASASGAAPTEARAAFDALVTLVGYARRDGIDLTKTLAEVRP